MFSLIFPLRMAVIIIVICGALVAPPLRADELHHPPLIDVLIVSETSPVYPGMYCVASYSILHEQLMSLDQRGIPPIVAEDLKARGSGLMVFLYPLAEEVEQLGAIDFTAEVLVLKGYLIAHVDGSYWLEQAEAYDCRAMTEQWAKLKHQHYSTPL